MKIYNVRTNINEYQYLEHKFDANDTSMQLHDADILCRCQHITESLTPPEVISTRPKLKRPEFWNFAPFFTFAVSPASLEKVRHFLEEAGELLPLPYQSQVFSVLNVLRCVDYQVFPELAPGRLHQAKAEGNIPHSIFRDLNRVKLYVSETDGNPATEFKAYVEHAGMTGLIFRQVWDST